MMGAFPKIIKITTMKKIILGLMIYVLIAGFVSFSFAEQAQARGRYGSTRIGGYTSNGKGSHYVGGHVRSCHGWACK